MQKPWDFLEEYRGKDFQGEWPTLSEVFRITTKRYPENNCFTVYAPKEMRWNYTEALAQIEATASYLMDQGISPGDRVAIAGKNSPEWAFAYLGTLQAGGVVVPIDYMLEPEEMKGLIERSGTKILFIDEERFDAFAPEGELKSVLSLSEKKPGYILDLKAEPRTEFPAVKDTDMAAILYTSGTTGVSKGVMLSHRNLVADCYLAQGNMTIYSTDVFYALLPIHHSYTMLAVFIESLSVGAEVIFGKRMAINQILKDLKVGKVTMFLGVPMLFNKLIRGVNKGLRDKGILVYGIMKGLMGISGFMKKVFKVNPGKKMFGKVLSKISMEDIRICICGGGPLPSSTFKQFNQLGIDFVQGYGLTEASPIVTLNPTYKYKEASIGKVLPNLDVKIQNPDADGIGEILVKGPTVMQGYYQMDEVTKETIDEDGYLHTGDLGYMDHERYIFLTGRAKSLIVTEGGKNVFPEEIEDKFQLFDIVEQVLVRGYEADKEMKTEGIEALIYPSSDEIKGMSKEDVEAKIQEIVDGINQELAVYKRISKIRVLDEPMEMTTTKKIKRFAIK